MNLLRLNKTFAAIGLAIAAFLYLYAGVLAGLVHDWATDDNYSHGFLIVPLAAYLAWERRGRLGAPSGAAAGLVVVMAGLGLLLAGVLGSEYFVARTSLVVTLAGGVLYLFGWQALRVLAFPVAVLFLMIPIPAIIFNQIALPLQLLASRVGESTLTALSIPVLREGNVLVLANTTLEVAEACSGIRSLVSLLTLGIVLGYFTDPRGTVRAAIALATVPIAILANGARVAGTGVAAHYFGPGAAEGFFHSFSGWLMFVFAFSLLLGLQRALGRIAPPPMSTSSVPLAA